MPWRSSNWTAIWPEEGLAARSNDARPTVRMPLPPLDSHTVQPPSPIILHATPPRLLLRKPFPFLPFLTRMLPLVLPLSLPPLSFLQPLSSPHPSPYFHFPPAYGNLPPVFLSPPPFPLVLPSPTLRSPVAPSPVERVRPRRRRLPREPCAIIVPRSSSTVGNKAASLGGRHDSDQRKPNKERLLAVVQRRRCRRPPPDRPAERVRQGPTRPSQSP